MVPAGHYLEWQNHQTRLEQYWKPQLYSGQYQPDAYYHERFAELFTESVRMRLMSEVPLGSYLSGGVDSSAIVATMSQLVEQPVKTFSVGFNWPGDELSEAQEVAQRLNCDHHEIICSFEDMALLPQIVWNLDVPFGDAIVLPMYMLSKLARQHVTVVLTGEGADETLGGYLMQRVMLWARRYDRWTPRQLQNWLIEPVVRQLPTGLLNLFFDYPAALGQRGRQKVLDYLALIKRRQPLEEYTSLISLFDDRDKLPLYSEKFLPALNAWPNDNGLIPQLDGEAAYLDEILALQYAHWLSDDILMKQDKMSMANSIEGRVPFMDHVLVEFLLQAPPHLKLQLASNKVLLRKYLKGILPGSASRRPKKPFYIPLDQYFSSGPLGEIMETCLSESSVRRRGYFRWSQVRALRDSVDKGEFMYGKQILALVMLELWHRIFIDREPGWVS